MHKAFNTQWKRPRYRRHSLLALCLIASVLLCAASASAEASPGSILLGQWELEGDSWRLEASTAPDREPAISLSYDQLLQGGPLLVNRQHPLPEEFPEASLVTATAAGYPYQVVDGDMKLYPYAYAALEQMLTDAESQGYTDYILREGYRSDAYQAELFEMGLERIRAQYPADGDTPLSDEALREETAKSVNLPGTSEYQTGLSFRMDIYNPEKKTPRFDESPQGEWLMQSCWKYGIVPRFLVEGHTASPWTDKSEQTDVTAKIYLFRYVGQPHATIMRLMDLCLEEYVALLQEHPYLTLYQNDQLRYEVLRVDAGERQAEYRLPGEPSILGTGFDNAGGIVLVYAQP